MRIMVLIGMMGCLCISSMGMDTYSELISETIQACESPDILLSSAFTNNVMEYRFRSTNAHEQCAADLALAISLMHRMDHDEMCVSNEECFRYHQCLVSNVVYCAGLNAGSWIKYAAAAEYMTGLNFGCNEDASFVLATNMVAEIDRHPPDMGATNYWASMSSWMRSPNESLQTVFRLNAAIWLSERNRMEEVEAYTNSLPESAIGIFLEELQ